MQICERVLQRLAQHVTGDSRLTPYRSGPQLVRVFNNHGFDDVYAQGFPSRWKYAEDRLRELNGTRAIRTIVEALLDPMDFLDGKFDRQAVVDDLNKYLRYDNLKLAAVGDYFRVLDMKGTAVDLDVVEPESVGVNAEFIAHQIDMCEEKIGTEDYWGAVAASRSLLEAVLEHIESKLDAAPPRYDGDLLRLYGRVQKLLNIDPSRKDLEDAHRQILSGLIRIVNGLAAMRNIMSDAHAPKYRAQRHHARLAVNSAKTVANFLYDTYSYQIDKGFLTHRSDVPTTGAVHQAVGLRPQRPGRDH